MLFLNDLAKASGDTSYSDFVIKKMNDLQTKVTYYGSGAANLSTDGNPGLTAAELVAAEDVIRGAGINGIKPWDLYHFVELAELVGKKNYSADIADKIKTQLDNSGFSKTTHNYIFGLAGGIMALKEAGIDYSSYLQKLVAEQNSDGHFETPDVDTGNSRIGSTAYALMALKDAGHAGARDAVKYLANNSGYAGINGGWLEGNGKEYADPDGEAGKALGMFIK